MREAARGVPRSGFASGLEASMCAINFCTSLAPPKNSQCHGYSMDGVRDMNRATFDRRHIRHWIVCCHPPHGNPSHRETPSRNVPE
jgi:hypothetical protein